MLVFKTLKHKGKAWVVFDYAEPASTAISKNGFPFYDKLIRIQFAKKKSDVIAKANGTFVPHEKRKRQEEKEGKKKNHNNSTQIGMSAYTGVYGAIPHLSQVPYPGGVKNNLPEGPAAPPPPNNILFVQHLPHDTIPTLLQDLLDKYHGFKEVRIVAAKPGIAFVQFADEMQSTVAMEGLQELTSTSFSFMRRGRMEACPLFVSRLVLLFLWSVRSEKEKMLPKVISCPFI
ncbi:unnamed protein product [Eruca vesicaria subsp. sativa]|uniref:RRM domain-containing protein n=1 Tax=Eruca vesicaria subsp. sativa TaxID=29727 RepID=A0ABC8JJQ3_ERUVS|nr:unnamed protein product [Eruca vesicaria subsp. sativa]